MILFPAVDIRGGRAVRLLKGDFNQETVFYDTPYEAAMRWEAEGAKFLHVVDLDGSKDGGNKNLTSIKGIVEHVKMPIQVGGGIRELDDIKRLFDVGVRRVILGTKALDEEFLAKALTLGEIVVSLDGEDGYIKTKGWTVKQDVKVIDLAKKIKAQGAKTVVYTDISKDGMLEGPDFTTTFELSDMGLDVIASGGITTKDDLDKLKKENMYGAILGKALYTGK
jgi:phosphoribosylformimino-5-aminoimidazole carboxamide ribotide isomerase